MQLGEFFNHVEENPSIVITYFILLPLVTVLANFMGKGEGNISPWKYLYSAVLYLAAVPGIFAVTLNIYYFLFEKKAIESTVLEIQILPILSMMVTLFLIRKNVSINEIPGADKISALVTIISCTMIFMWILEKTRIYVFTTLPFQVVLLIFVVLFLLIRFSWSRLISK